MFEFAVTPKSSIFFPNTHFKFGSGFAASLRILSAVVLVVLMTTSCGTVAQAAGAQGTNGHDDLVVSGNVPGGVINQSYNAVLSVSGGSAPYYFSVKDGTLPPGITMNPNTGTFSGKPTTTGYYEFQVIVTDSPRLDQGSQLFAIPVTANGSGGGHIAVNLTPASASVVSNQQQQFTATVSGTSNTAVTWTTTAGSINPTGLFTAPTVNKGTSATVTATSKADTTQSASVTVSLQPAKQTQPLQVTTSSLPQGQVGSAYSDALAASGGTQPYSWSVTTGNPPTGISLNGGGTLGGTPSTAETSNFTVTVTDAASHTATASLSMTVNQSGNYDGPAELPLATVDTAMADTPAAGNTIAVAANGDFRDALNNANCGDTITLQAGATYTGQFTLPAKNCDANHWIIIRTSAPDGSLPPEGSRVTPCYAGVASLPGRPSFNCSNTNDVLAKVTFPDVGAGPIILASGANHYRILGLEITRVAGTGPVGPLVFTQNNPADSIIVDRCWLHGTTQDETFSGVDFRGMTNAAVINSFMTDFHCTAQVGTCTDAQDIGGGLGSLPGGPYLIMGNFLEAAGENILFGGGPATVAPADITIQGNHFFKPLIWQQGRPGYQGGKGGHPFVVKNHFELKNAQRVLFEGNILENNWGGFTQFGHSILLTPKNQWSLKLKQDVCPLCVVTDVTIRYSTISHVGAGISIATVLAEGGGQASAGERYSIHDITVDDVNAQNYNGHGGLLLIQNNWTQNVLNSLTINHITGFGDPSAHVVSIMGGSAPNIPEMWGFVLTNSILGLGPQSVASAGGGPKACAHTDKPLPVLETCFTSYTFNYNAIIGSALGSDPSDWPSGNFFPTTPAIPQFTDYNNADGGNYTLLSSSPYIAAGSDGSPIGADISAIQNAIAGVY